jgi:DNA-binding LytR/AlgR family response regulator
MARLLLTEFIGKVPNLNLAGSFSNALSALPALQSKPIDVVFLDIQMPGISGIDFIKTLDKRPRIILTTAFAEYALEGFELDVVDYLLKPFEFNRFLKAVNKIQASTATNDHTHPTPDTRGEKNFIFIKDGTRLVRIDLSDIRYIKGTREYVTVCTRNRKVMSLQTLQSLEQTLPKEFIRVHNSYIIYIPAIQSVDKNSVEIDHESIPIGNTYKKNFFSILSGYSPGSAG